jgi:hypothetical protein
MSEPRVRIAAGEIAGTAAGRIAVTIRCKPITRVTSMRPMAESHRR